MTVAPVTFFNLSAVCACAILCPLHWKLLRNLEGCWKVLRNVERCWKVWKGAERCGKVLGVGCRLHLKCPTCAGVSIPAWGLLRNEGDLHHRKPIWKVQVPDSPSEHTRATIHSQEINESVKAKGLQSRLSQVKLTKSGLSMTFMTTNGPWVTQYY